MTNDFKLMAYLEIRAYSDLNDPIAWYITDDKVAFRERHSVFLTSTYTYICMQRMFNLEEFHHPYPWPEFVIKKYLTVLIVFHTFSGLIPSI